MEINLLIPLLVNVYIGMIRSIGLRDSIPPFYTVIIYASDSDIRVKRMKRSLSDCVFFRSRKPSPRFFFFTSRVERIKHRGC